jgi:ribonuclease R
LTLSTSKKRRIKDPHAGREAANYEHPLPSREFILQIMEEEGAPVSIEQLYKLLDIRKAEREIFNRRLGAMLRDGQVFQNRKGALCLAEKVNLIPGKVLGHPDGFGFLVPDAGGDDLFLSPKEMGQVMHGDRVLVRQAGFDRRGRPEGKVVEILERTNTRIVGRLIVESGVVLVAAEDRRIAQDILIPPGQEMKAKAGQVVVAELVEQPSLYAKPIGKVVEILGNYADPGMEIEIALRKHQLPYLFNPEAVKQAEAYPRKVRKSDWKERIDLRELPLVTIDGETARDFDDAVYCEPQGKGWRLVVAIADVSFYVRPEDALDKDAYERGNSVYFPRRVIPMLPEALSNGLCSLNPDVERLCMVCDMQIDGKGKIKKYQFYPSVMLSKARMTYTKVYDMIVNPQGETAREYAWLMPHVGNLYALFQILLKARATRGAIEFETTETLMMFNDQGKIDKIVPVVRNDAHRLIEECMLAANVCASDFLAKHEHPTLYRIHEGPTQEKLEKVRGFMAEFGFTLGGGDAPHAKDYGKLLEHIKGRPDEQLLQTVLLRSMQQAVYSPDNVGHFGLAYEHYTHFTSPIRRYPDLLVHRAIKAVLEGKKYRAGDWNALGMHCSMTERRADDATRDVETWLKCYYMQDKVGESFTGTVAGVASFGLFVALDEVYVEGLLHVTELGNDYFNFDPVRHEMLGERTGVRFRLGDRLRVKVARVDMETSKIDFVLDPLEPVQVSTPTEKPAKMPAASPTAKRTTRAPGKPASKPKAGPAAGSRSRLGLPGSSTSKAAGPSSTRGKSKSKSTSRKGSKKK